MTPSLRLSMMTSLLEGCPEYQGSKGQAEGYQGQGQTRFPESVPATPPVEVVALPEAGELSLAPVVAAVKLDESAAQAAGSDDVGSASWATSKR
eukprot:6249817-Prymnesium_polylepis.1